MDQKVDQKKVRDESVYISNPFKLAFEATGRLFENNKAWAIILILLGVIGAIPRIGNNSNTTNQDSVSTTLGSNPDTTTTIALVVFIAGFVVLFLLMAIVVGTYVQGMLSYVALQSEKGKSVKFSEAFKAVSERFWHLFLAQVLAFFKIIGWSLLLIVPGIIAALRYSLLSYVVMDQPPEQKSVKEVHNRLKTITKSRLIEVFGVSFTGIIPVAGGLFDLAGKAALYRQFQVFTDKNLEKPKVHWLNYLAVILLGALLVLGAIIAVIFIAAWQSS